MTKITCYLRNCRCNEDDTCRRGEMEIDKDGNCSSAVPIYTCGDCISYKTQDCIKAKAWPCNGFEPKEG